MNPSTAEGLGRSNPKVRRLRRLLDRRSDRHAEGVFVVEGPHAVGEAMAAGAAIEAVYAAPEAPERVPDVLHAAEAAGVPVEWLAPGVMERIADTVNPQPVLAVVHIPDVALDDVDVSLVVVLADVREPGNAGTIVRGAEAAGATAVVFCRGSVDPFAPKVVRASAGGLFHIPIVMGGEPGEVLEVLAQRGTRCLGTAVDRGEQYHDVDWSRPTTLVLGNEAWGLPGEVGRYLETTVTIPMPGRSESLNVAMAASVLLFEAARQRAR